MVAQTTLDVHGADDDSNARSCLVLTVEGPWGHFRRVDGNTIKQTYRVIPRTTVAGLLAAIAGYDRDSYYEAFAENQSYVAIEPLGSIRTTNLPENSLTTSGEGMKAVNARGKVSVRYPDPTKDRQRQNYEVLVDPSYRIYVWTSDNTFYERLREMLSDGKSHYVPSLGLSEHLATVEYQGECSIVRLEPDDPVSVDSAIFDPDGLIPAPDITFGTERSPGYMERTREPGSFTGRRTTGFLTVTYTTDGSPLRVDGTAVSEVEIPGIGRKRVVFA